MLLTATGGCRQVSRLDTMAGLAVKYNVTVRHGRAPFAEGALCPSLCSFLPSLHLESLAVRGGVLHRVWCLTMQVSDIKRANGLLSDSAMFARDNILIPTRPIVIGCVRHSGP